MAGVLGLVVEILGDGTELDKALGKSEGSVAGWAGGIGKTALKIGAVAGVAGLAATAIADMTMAAAADRDEQNKLETQLGALGLATGDYLTVVDDAIAAGQERAFTDSETRDALGTLATATGDLTLAQSDLAVAQDVARLAGVDLAVAADAVAKAHAGQDGALAKLIPGLTKGADGYGTIANAAAAAAGQADTFANSTEGSMAKSGDAFGELQETIGSVFLPILDEILPALTPILKAFGTLVESLLPLLVPLVKTLGAVLGIVARALSTVVGWLVKLVQWITSAIGKVGDFLAKLNPLQNIELPSLPFLSSSTASAGPQATTRAAGTTRSSSSAPVVNVYTTADSIDAERAVVRALRRVTRLNGGVIPARGWAV